MYEVEIQASESTHLFLHTLEEEVDRWLRDLVDDTVDRAGTGLRAHAPGGIDAFVTEDGAALDRGDFIEGFAGVLPDLDQEFSGRGLGSSPADYPYYVDVGTGVFGEYGTPITAGPGRLMGPIEYGGRMIYVRQIQGQPAQDYSGAAARDTDAWLEARLRGPDGPSVISK